MASVSPSSSVSRVAGGDRVGLEIPQAPSSILGAEFASADSGAKLRVVEAYYLALAKYYEARVVERSDESSVGSTVESSVVSEVVSAVSSTRSRRRRRRRSVESRLRREARGSSEFESVPELSYLFLIAPVSRYDARAELGRSPRLSQLLASPREWFLRGSELSAVKCRVGGQAVVFGVDGVRSAVDVLAHVSAGFRTARGSFGAELHAKLDPGVLVDSGFIVDSVVGIDSDEVSSLLSVPGYCYLRLVKPECVVSASEYGRSVDVGRLLSMPASVFRAGVFDSRVAVSRIGLLHVDPGGSCSLGQVLTEAVLNSSVEFDRVSLAYGLKDYRCEPVKLGVRLEWRVGAGDVRLKACGQSDVQALRESLAGLASLDACEISRLDVIAVLGLGLGFAAQWRKTWLGKLGNGVLESALAMRTLVWMDECPVPDRDFPVASVDDSCIRALRESGQEQLSASASLAPVDAYKLLIALVFRAGSFDAVFRFMDVTRFECEH